MKRFYVLLICVLVILALAAFLSDVDFTGPQPTQPPTAPPTDPPTAPPTTPTTDKPTDPTDPPTVPTETDPVIQDLPMNAIILTDHTESYTDDDGSILFNYTYQNVMLMLENQDMIDTVTLDLLNRIDSTRASAEHVLDSSYSAGTKGPYWLTVRYEPQRIDSGILSMTGQEVSYSGGSHPNISPISVTYDLTKGKALNLGEILTESTTADVLCRLVVDALNSQTELYLYEDFSATVEERFSGYIQEDENWYLSRQGLCFAFAPYEIAPYSSGVVTAVIPYSQLLGVLEDAYFPTEQVYAEGKLNAELYHEADQSLYSTLAEVILDHQGAAFLLTADDLIYDVTVTRGYWDYAGIRFTPEYTVFAADCMTPGTAVMIQADIPDVMSNLRITYTSGDETVTVYLFMSGEDGSALLLPG